MTQKIYLISTAPPRACGIATFSENIIESFKLVWNSQKISMERIPLYSENEVHSYEEYQLKIRINNREDYLHVANTINADPQCAGVFIQHEYGIYGGNDGEYIVDLVKHVRKPILTTLHTVLQTPSPNQCKILRDLSVNSNQVSVMIESSKEILVNDYGIVPEKIIILAHGIPHTPFRLVKEPREILGLPRDSLITLTFGLLGPGKGIENAIKSVAANLEKHPELHYLIVGATHPNVVLNSGETYRDGLKQLAQNLGADNNIHFVNKFVEEEELLDWIQASDLYICPPENPQQASSGTLAYALGAGRPVLATNFLHAKDIVTENRGRLVEIGDVDAMKDALNELLGDKRRLYRMGKNAYFETRSWLWTNVLLKIGHTFKSFTTDMALELQIPDPNLSPLLKRTDQIGMWQFGDLNNDSQIDGYTLDDNARAAIAASKIVSAYPESLLSLQALSLIDRYIKFTLNSFESTKTVHNYFTNTNIPDYDRNSLENLDDARARGIWAVGEIISNETIPSSKKVEVRKLWHQIISDKDFVLPEKSLRASCFTGLGIISVLTSKSYQEDTYTNTLILALNNRLKNVSDTLRNNSDQEWNWYEPIICYANAVISEFHLRSAKYFNNSDEESLALRALRFLNSCSHTDTVATPVGQNGWYPKNGIRADFDQQPEEPAHLTIANCYAYKYTGDKFWQEHALASLTWFYGNNVHKIRVYNHYSGAVYDGLTKLGLNLNEGAESLVMYLIALVTFKENYNE